MKKPSPFLSLLYPKKENTTSVILIGRAMPSFNLAFPPDMPTTSAEVNDQALSP